MNPRVSVVLITYNHIDFIDSSLHSILNQDLEQPWEVIVADDSSTDGTSTRIDSILATTPTTAAVRHIRSASNVGLQANLRRALSTATGTFVALLEGDDYWTDASKLRTQASCLDADTTLAAVRHHTIMLPPDHSDYVPGTPVQYTQSFPSGRYSLHDVLLRRFPHTSSLMFRRDLLPSTPAWFDALMLADWPICSILATHGDIEIQPDAMSVYRSGIGIHSTAGELQQWERTLQACRVICDNLNLPQRSKRASHARVYYAFGAAAARNNKPLLASHMFAQCVARKPSIIWQRPRRTVQW